jgi:hypothetical protein
MAILGRRTIHLNFFAAGPKTGRNTSLSQTQGTPQAQICARQSRRGPPPRQPAFDPTTTASIRQAPVFTKHPIFFIFFFTYTAPHRAPSHPEHSPPPADQSNLHHPQPTKSEFSKFFLPAPARFAPLNPRDQICIYPFEKYEKIEKNRKKLAKS